MIHVEPQPTGGPSSQQQTLPLFKLPGTMNGRIDWPADRDRFRIKATANRPITFTLLAAQLGTPIDGVLTIFDRAGKRLSDADDTPLADLTPPVVRWQLGPTSSDDPVLVFTPPADGEYQIEVSDRFNAGSPRHIYRLTGRTAGVALTAIGQPTQLATARPTNNRGAQRAQARVQSKFDGDGTGALSLDRGGSGAVSIRLLRTGPTSPLPPAVEIRAENLPEGVTAEPVTIAGNQKQATLRFNAAFNAPCAARLVRLVAVAKTDGAESPQLIRQPVILCSRTGQATASLQLDHFAVGVSDQGAELVLLTKWKAPQIVPGTNNTLVVTAKRRDGVTGPVKVAPVSLSSDLQLPELTIPAGEESREVIVKVNLDAAEGKRTLRLRGSLQRPPQGKKKLPLIVADSSVSFSVKPLVVTKLLKPQLTIKRGQSLPVTLEITLNRPLDGPIEFNFRGLPRGTSIKPLNNSANNTKQPGVVRIELQVSASAEARTSALRKFVRIAPSVKAAGKTFELPQIRLALKVQR